MSAKGQGPNEGVRDLLGAKGKSGWLILVILIGLCENYYRYVEENLLLILLTLQGLLYTREL